MDHVLGLGDATKRNFRVWIGYRRERESIVRGRRNAMESHGLEARAFAQPHDAEARFANPGRVLKHSAEHWLQLAWRAADHAKHIGRRGLLQQRIFAQLAQEPRIFDRDHRLGSKVLHKFDLLFGEGAHLLAVNDDSSDQ